MPRAPEPVWRPCPDCDRGMVECLGTEVVTACWMCELVREIETWTLWRWQHSGPATA